MIFVNICFIPLGTEIVMKPGLDLATNIDSIVRFSGYESGRGEHEQ